MVNTQETRYVVKPNVDERAWELLEQHGETSRLLARCYDGSEHRSLLATAIAVFLNTGLLSIDEADFVARREYELELANAQDTNERLSSLLFDCASILHRYHHAFSPKMQSTTAVLLEKVVREDLGRFEVSAVAGAPKGGQREREYMKRLEEVGAASSARMLYGTWEGEDKDALPGETK